MSSLPSATAFVADDDAPVTVAFTLQARAEPGVMPRVVELFAKRGLVPQKWHSTAVGTVLTIEVQTSGIGRDLGEYMARVMRQIVGVDTVLTVES